MQKNSKPLLCSLIKKGIIVEVKRIGRNTAQEMLDDTNKFASDRKEGL